MAQERVSKLEAALRRRRHSSQPQGGVEESPPTSRAKVAQCESFLERAKKREAAASPSKVDTVECRGGGRGATVGDASSQVGAPPGSSCHSQHVHGGAEVACSRGTVVEGVCPQTDPNPKRVLSGRFRPTVRRGDARVDPRLTEGSASGHRGRASLRKRPSISHLMSAQEWQRIFQEQPFAIPSAVANMVR